LIANNEDDAIDFYREHKEELPKHVYYDISEYAVDNQPIEEIE
jgi:hypothetical protein